MTIILQCIALVFLVSPGWYYLTMVYRADLPLESLTPLEDSWRLCRNQISVRAPSARPALSDPWTIILMAVDATDKKHLEMLKEVHKNLTPLFHQLDQLFPGLHLQLQSRYHTPLLGQLSPELLSSTFQIKDWSLDVTSQQSRFELIVYFSDRDTAPYQAFTVGKSAAVVMVRCVSSACHRDDPHEALAQTVSGLLSLKMRDLLGLTSQESSSRLALEQKELTSAELANIQQLFTKDYIDQSLRLIHSLGDIVDSMTNMEIKDQIRDDIVSSINHLESSILLMCSPKLDTNTSRLALTNALRSVEAASRAYFDPTLVSMLYFPAEHTLAIYGSMFLTTLTTLVMAFFGELKHCRQKRRNATTDTSTSS